MIMRTRVSVSGGEAGIWDTEMRMSVNRDQQEEQKSKGRSESPNERSEERRMPHTSMPACSAGSTVIALALSFAR